MQKIKTQSLMKRKLANTLKFSKTKNKQIN